MSVDEVSDLITDKKLVEDCSAAPVAQKAKSGDKERGMVILLLTTKRHR